MDSWNAQNQFFIMPHEVYTDLYLPLLTEQLTLLRNLWGKTNIWEVPNFPPEYELSN